MTEGISMSDNPNGNDDAFPTEIRTFVGRRVENDAVIGALSIESQAALRQFSFERLLGYGIEYTDAVELRARVLDGQPLLDAATELAETCLMRAEAAGVPRPNHATALTQAVFLRRASALLRISQVMMLVDTAERREIYARAVEAFGQAARLTGDREPFRVESGEGPLVGWRVPATVERIGSAIVIGGIEGYAMDFDAMGAALAARGVDAYLVDAPGQGATRFVHGTYLSPSWLGAFGAVIDEIEVRSPGTPIGFVGNSVGGALAMAVAAADPRIAACCDNGGIATPWLVPPSIGTFFTKMMAFCNAATEEQSQAIWRAVDPTADGPNTGYPLLIVHGGRDPLVSDAMVDMVRNAVPTNDQEMVVFTDGDHCIYNHREERDMLIADWMAHRLNSAAAKR